MSQSKGANAAEVSPVHLSEGNWYPANLQDIRQIIEDLTRSASQERLVAVFDFDNTCIFRDIGQAVFRYQLYALRYRITPEKFAALLPTSNEILDGKPMERIVATLVDLYSQLWSFVEQKQVEEAFKLDIYPQFTTLLLWFTEKARKHERLGPRYVLPLLAQLLAGFSTTELARLTTEVIASIEKEPLQTASVQAVLPAPIEQVTTSYEQGLQPFSEMRTLIDWLTSVGVECHIVSASTDWLVKASAKKLGFTVLPENIYGIRVALEENEVLSEQEQPGYPVTFREGKVEVIERFIQARPIMVAGDADTDYEMLTLPDVPVRLIINRLQTGIISSLYTDSRFLLQGINIATGRFRPSANTIVS